MNLQHKISEKVSRLNILYVSSEAGLGGANRSLCDMLVYMRNYIKPIVVIPDCGGLSNELDQMNIMYYVVKLNRGYGRIGQHSRLDEENDFIINYEAAVQIREIIKAENIELLHINSSVCNAGAMGAILAEIPYIWHIREIPGKQFNCEFWDMPLKNRLFCNADKFLTISECVRKEYVQNYGIVSDRIYNGLNCEKYVQDLKKEKDEKYGFLVAGAIISEEKGQLDVIKAVKVLNKKGLNHIRVYIVGNYSYRFEWCLKRYIKIYKIQDQIILCPFKNDLSDFHSKCEYAIVASKFEALGRVTIEAMLAGNIVIGANTGGTLEIIGEDEERGYTYTEGDSQSLADVMLKVIKEDDRKKANIKEKAQKFALHTFDCQKYAKDLHSIYEEVLAGYKNRKNDNLLRYLENRYKDTDTSEAGGMRTVTLKRLELSELEEKLYNNKERIKSFLTEMDLRKIAIYGMGALGCRLYDILEDAQFELPYVIDRNPFFIKEIVKVFSPEDMPPFVDAIIITTMKDGEKIRERYLERNITSNIFILVDVLQMFES